MVYLRKRKEEDIPDYVHWFTTETEWCLWDAPWEDNLSPAEEVKMQQYEALARQAALGDDATLYHFEIDDETGRHIGWINAYHIDENLSYFPEPEKPMLAIGIDLPDPACRGRGLGTEAFRLAIDYYRKKGLKELYTQTWSGNTRMMRMAEKAGFKEFLHIPGIRHWQGKTYDALTFIIEL